MAPAALIVVPDAPAASLGAVRATALHALLTRRALAWALQVAPGAAFAAFTPGAAAPVPRGVEAFEAPGLAAAVERVGRGPLLVAGTACPRLGPAHATAALGDLAAGCDLVLGSTLDGGWYLVGLREPRPELVGLAPLRRTGMGGLLRPARELGVEVGLLRHERVLATPDDAAALAADPLVDAELRAVLAAFSA